MQVQVLHTSTSCMKPMVGTKSCIHLPISHLFFVEKKLKQKALYTLRLYTITQVWLLLMVMRLYWMLKDITLVVIDVGRFPFAKDSIDVVHVELYPCIHGPPLLLGWKPIHKPHSSSSYDNYFQCPISHMPNVSILENKFSSPNYKAFKRSYNIVYYN